MKQKKTKNKKNKKKHWFKTNCLANIHFYNRLFSHFIAKIFISLIHECGYSLIVCICIIVPVPVPVPVCLPIQTIQRVSSNDIWVALAIGILIHPRYPIFPFHFIFFLFLSSFFSLHRFTIFAKCKLMLCCHFRRKHRVLSLNEIK